MHFIARRVSDFYLKNKIFNFLKEDLNYLENPEYQKYLEGTKKIVIGNVIEDIKKTINEQVIVAKNQAENEVDSLEKTLNTSIDRYKNKPGYLKNLANLINCQLELTAKKLSNTDSDSVLAFLEEVNQSLEKFSAATLK